ncbi:MAG TPA: LuxR C-terminal-related transcriptional regulator [Solirubrobacteraceae bacterium]|nr:LuxR C-terminal-related transcriptional regulator [Solirubrobacteraceae bacterium]
MTSRPSLGMFFQSLGSRKSTAVTTATVDLAPAAVRRASRTVAMASVALVDASIDPSEALEVCNTLRAQRPDLRIGALFCCTHAATPDAVRPFLDSGIGSFIDLQLSAVETLAALRAIARGDTVVRLALSGDSGNVLFSGRHGNGELSADDHAVLRLLALGSTDREIGAELCLSHHTIKHRIERLCRRLQARNRVQLAAFAGRMDRAGGATPS